MILIISHNQLDEPTNSIIDWLSFFGETKYLRINGDDYSINNIFDLDVNNETISNDKLTINCKEIKAIFYRRWRSPKNNEPLYKDYLKLKYTVEDVKLLQNFQAYFNAEYSCVLNGIFSFLKSASWMPNVQISRKDLYKIDVLSVVKEYGVSIPPTIITSTKKNVLKFYEKHKNIITKPIKDVFVMNYEGNELLMYTKKVEKDDIPDFDTFF
jgi:hypothetical protein